MTDIVITLISAFNKKRRFSPPVAPEQVIYHGKVYARSPGEAEPIYRQRAVFELNDEWRMPDLPAGPAVPPEDEDAQE